MAKRIDGKLVAVVKKDEGDSEKAKNKAKEAEEAAKKAEAKAQTIVREHIKQALEAMIAKRRDSLRSLDTASTYIGEAVNPPAASASPAPQAPVPPSSGPQPIYQ